MWLEMGAIVNAGEAGWFRRYQSELRKHVRFGPRSSRRGAQLLGLRAVALGMETLDVARFHVQALMRLASTGGSSRTTQKVIERAKIFFAETVVPIERTHGAAMKADVRVNQLTQRMRRRTAESSASTRRLERGIAQSKAAEAALMRSGKRRRRLLRESHRLQNRLQRQTRKILTAQENERQRTSRELHDEVAQALLAIHLRLLTLKTSAKANTGDLEKEIAQTQGLVQDSVKTIGWLAHEIGVNHET
jgi:signal transduction histidine kinase